MILIEPPRSLTAARRSPINKRELAQFAARASKAAGAAGAVSVLLTNDERIRELNRRFRKKNAATDVLSFPSFDGQRSRSAGDLAISLDTAARQAEIFQHSLDTEVRVLILHGILHLAGFDHETDDGEMAKIERRLRKEFGLPSGLIQRSTKEPAKVKPPDRRSLRTPLPVISERHP
ncbi:rRNA maturation RNase YbeY [Acidisarcina polymorpha]|nr:rRNA maturation RNase YbeY [Acidisarcina polymorpha]